MHLYLKQYQKFLKSQEKFYANKIVRVLHSQISTFINTRNVNAISSGEMYKELKSLYTRIGTIQGHRAMLAIKHSEKNMRPIGFNEQMQLLLDTYFRTHLLNTAEKITSTTRQMIQDILIEGTRLGLAFTEIAAKIQTKDITIVRARLIARTEITTASNAGAMLAAQSTGLKLVKTWLSTNDYRTRGSKPKDKFDHVDMNNVTVEGNAFFFVGGQNMLHPGDRTNGATAGNICNCRCTVIFLPKP